MTDINAPPGPLDQEPHDCHEPDPPEPCDLCHDETWIREAGGGWVDCPRCMGQAGCGGEG